MSSPGKVYLVGAGPGDPGLLTLKGLACLQQADLVLYDGLVNPLLLEHTRAKTERTRREGKGGRKVLDQDAINRRLVDEARAGRTVVRLKGGDPLIFGRGAEEARVLSEAGGPFEIVPGITAATAAAAYAAADVAICRAGALTVAEVTAVGLPCLLVPFPHAADNHQEANARVVLEADAGHMLREDEWTSEAVSRWLLSVGTEPTRRQALSRNARGLARPEATQLLVDHLEVLAA